MRLRQKGQQFPPEQLESLLLAFGSTTPALPATITVLDEIITDFIIETCHAAALSASYSRRQKIKVDDFKWVLRRDAKKLGRVTETFFLAKQMSEARKVMDFGDAERLGKGKRGLEGLVGEEEGGKKKKRKGGKEEE